MLLLEPYAVNGAARSLPPSADETFVGNDGRQGPVLINWKTAAD